MVKRIDRERVVEAALRLLDETGLDGLTLRGIAKELDVQAPALYWHFAGKQALLDAMATEMLRRMHADLPPLDGDWRASLAAASHALRRGLLAHRDGAKVFSGSTLTDSSHGAVLERRVRTFTDAGFTPAQAAEAIFTAHTFTVGFVIEEQTVRPLPGGARDPRYAPGADPAAGDTPLFAAATEALFADFDARFATGLRIITAGIARVLGPDADAPAP